MKESSHINKDVMSVGRSVLLCCCPCKGYEKVSALSLSLPKTLSQD